MANISLEEFREISGLSDTAIIWLLANNSLTCSVDQEKGILIEVNSLDYNKITSELANKLDAEFLKNRSILSARITKVVKENIAGIVSEAVKSIES